MPPQIKFSELQIEMVRFQNVVRDVADYPDRSKTDVVIGNARRDLRSFFERNGIALKIEE